MINIKEFLNLTYYTSKLDQFLNQFRHSQHYSASQRAEKNKHDAIFKLRDKSESQETIEKHWDKF